MEWRSHDAALDRQRTTLGRKTLQADQWMRAIKGAGKELALRFTKKDKHTSLFMFSEDLIHILCLHETIVGGITRCLHRLDRASRHKVQWSYRCGGLCEIKDVFGATHPKRNIFNRSDIRDGRYRFDLVNSNVLDLWNHAGVNPDLVPAVLAEECCFESFFLGGDDDCVDLAWIHLCFPRGCVRVYFGLRACDTGQEWFEQIGREH